MSKKEKVKGRNFEYRVVSIAKEYDLPARRIVLSGSTEEKGDVEIAGFKFECKYRSNGFTTLRQWVDKAIGQGLTGVVLGGHRAEPLVVIPARDFFGLVRMMRRAENNG